MKPTLALCLLAGCGLTSTSVGPSASGPPPAEALWHYDVTLSQDHARLDVRLALTGVRPPRVILGMAEGLPYLEAPVASWDGGERPLVRTGDAFSLDGVGRGATIRYRVDFGRLVDDRLGSRVGNDVCASPGLFLLRPNPLPDAPAASLALHLPPGETASVPWTQDASGAYLLDETAFRWRGFAAFGRMERHEVRAAGATLDVVLLDRPRAATWPGIERWITRAADTVASLYGGFPVPRAQIVVRPVASNEAVPFGETQRGGGPAVLLLLGDEAKDADFARDWVAVHEFAHLGMPAIPEPDAWLSEGFITYYQVVLMGRAGYFDERGAWDDMAAGFERGRGQRSGGRTLADTSAAMGRTHSYFRVYWGGAAIALHLDAELRRSTSGARSLDDAIREVHRAFAGHGTEASAAEVVKHLDAWLGRPLFSEITAAALASTEFPDTAALLAPLGVSRRAGRTSLDDDAPDAAIRRAIMAGAPR